MPQWLQVRHSTLLSVTCHTTTIAYTPTAAWQTIPGFTPRVWLIPARHQENGGKGLVTNPVTYEDWSSGCHRVCPQFRVLVVLVLRGIEGKTVNFRFRFPCPEHLYLHRAEGLWQMRYAEPWGWGARNDAYLSSRLPVLLHQNAAPQNYLKWGLCAWFFCFVLGLVLFGFFSWALSSLSRNTEHS